MLYRSVQVNSPAPKSVYVSGVSVARAMGQKTSKVKAAEATGTTKQTVCEWIVDDIITINFTCSFLETVQVMLPRPTLVAS